MKIVILGAGPTGLGAAWRLQELGYKDWQIYERNNYVGGLSASFKDDKGFTWDVGGHILFSHYEYFDRLFEKLLNKEYLQYQRRAFIWVCSRFVPYPFQNNIRYLPFDKVIECLWGLAKIKASKNSRPDNFRQWIISTFGGGIAKYFMLPHNSKVWSYPLDEMSYHWIGERVSQVDIKRVLRNVIFFRRDVSWGPNNRFKFPLFAGTGGLFEKIVPYIKNNLRLNKRAEKIDLNDKKVIFSDKSEDHYDFLISTMPLDRFIQQADLPEFKEEIKKLKHNGALIVGIGLKKKCPSDKCWMYFPESDSPFYRVTYFSNYSPNNAPEGDYYSLMCESAYSEYRVRDKDKIIEETIQGLINTKILSTQDRQHIVSTYLIDADYAYPIPTLDRDKALGEILPYLEEKSVYSCGRFGLWKYEAGNMDHSVMQGKETVDKILGAK